MATRRVVSERVASEDARSKNCHEPVAAYLTIPQSHEFEMLDDDKFMSSIEFVNFMARSGLRTWTWMTRCRSTNEARFIPMQPKVVGLVAGRGGENLKRLKQLPDVDSIEVYTNDADGQFEGRIHKQAGADDRKWIVMVEM